MKELPKGWAKIPLGKLLEEAQPGFACGKKDRDGFIQVRMNNVTTSGDFDWSKTRRVPATEKQLSKYSLKPGDLVFNSTNSPNLVGKSAVVEAQLLAEAPLLFSNHFLRLRFLDKVSERYILRFFNMLWQQKVFENACVKWVNQASLRKESLMSLKIPLPPLAEQKRIAAILDQADALRRNRQEALRLSETLLQSVFLSVVGPENPDYNRWPTSSIKDIAAKNKQSMRTGPFGSALKHSEFVDSGVAVLGIDNAVNNEFCWGERRHITKDKYKSLHRYKVYPQDVIITIMGTTGRSAVVPDSIPEAISTKHLATITVDQSLATPEFVSNAIHRHPLVLRQIQMKNRGAIMAGLNLGIIKQLELQLPPIKKQREFDEKTQSIRQLRKLQQQQLAEAETLFQALMQRAFRGEL